jgi:hypothetical protein
MANPFVANPRSKHHGKILGKIDPLEAAKIKPRDEFGMKLPQDLKDKYGWEDGNW